MKECIECGKRKSLDDFYKNSASIDGKTSKCVECSRAYAKQRLKKKQESMPEGWKQKAKDKVAYQKEWSAKNPGYYTEKKREWWHKNKDRLKVAYAVKYAVKSGKLIKLPCFVCGEIEVEGHHPDYSRPLDVVWLCKTHHREVHR